MKITKCKYTILQIVDIGTNLIFLLIEKKPLEVDQTQYHKEPREKVPPNILNHPSNPHY